MKKTILALVLFSGSVYAADGSKPEQTFHESASPDSIGIVTIVKGSSLDKTYHEFMNHLKVNHLSKACNVLGRMSPSSQRRAIAICAVNAALVDAPVDLKNFEMNKLFAACDQKTA